MRAMLHTPLGAPLLSLVTALAAPSPVASGHLADRAEILVIRNATVFDAENGRSLPHHSVLVEGGRIRAVGPDEEIQAPAAAEQVDAGGGSLLPGLIDSHAHLSVGPVALGEIDGAPALVMEEEPGLAARTLLTLFAHGVTTVRDPAGETARAVALEEAVTSGRLLGPDPVVAGSVLDPLPFRGLVQTISNAEGLRAAVRSQAAAGVDFVKLYTGLTPELVQAAVEEARRAGIDTAGHLEATTWTEASRMGVDALEHLLPGSAALLPEKTRESYGRNPGTLAFAAWYQRVDLDSAPIREMVRALAEEGTFVVPTLVMLEATFHADLPGGGAGTPRLELVHPELRKNWSSFFHFNLGWEPEHFERGRAVWPRIQELIRRLWEAGVLLAAGTDANNPWIVPGPSLHRELELLVEAGIPAAAVLRMATLHGAALAGRLEDRGTIATGKRADLVLVDGDPLADISAVRAIRWVMLNGRLHLPAELLSNLP